MGDTVRVTFTCPRWVVTALEDAIAEAVEGCEEDGDPGLLRWAEGLCAIRATVTTVDSRPDPVGKVWSMRECRYVAR